MSADKADPPYPKSPDLDGLPQPYPPQYPDTVVVEQPCPIITDSHFVPGPDPVNTVCPYCHKDVTTLVTYKTGILTWAGCFGIFIIGGIFGCCLIPFCCDSCKDADHRCPVCNRDLGLYRRC